MKLTKLLPVSMLALAVGATMSAAHAAPVYDGISLISGQQSFTDSFSVAGPGTLTMSLTSVPWLDVVSNLSGFLSSSSGQIGTTINGAGTESFDLVAGTYYAHWFGDAHGTYNLGVVGLKIDFQPNSATPVPLSKSLVFLLSGLGLLFGWQSRKPGSATTPVLTTC